MLVTMNMRKSPRVADENMLNDVSESQIFPREMERRRPSGWWVFSILSCFSQPNVNALAADGVWVSSEYVQVSSSEINHLMVSDSMRYAILM